MHARDNVPTTTARTPISKESGAGTRAQITRLRTTQFLGTNAAQPVSSGLLFSHRCSPIQDSLLGVDLFVS